MKDPQSVARNVEAAFDRIHCENMQGIPILNTRINVECIGFQSFQERVVGVVITPWLMTVILLPSEDEDWSNLELGRKKFLEFPSKSYKFMLNEFEGIGFCQTHSLHSPMKAFSSHEFAVKAAEDFIEKMMLDSNNDTEDPIDEDLLGQIMRGEVAPEVNLDDFATIEAYDKKIPIDVITDMKTPAKKSINRRALLRGRFQGGE